MKNIRKFKEKSKYDEYMETSKVYPLLNYIEDIDKARPEIEPATYFIAKMNYNDASMSNITNRGGIYRSLLVDGVEYITDSASTLLQQETIEITYDMETGNIPSNTIFDVNTEKYIVKLKEPLTENDAMVINFSITQELVDAVKDLEENESAPLEGIDISQYNGKNIIIGLPMKEILEIKTKTINDIFKDIIDSMVKSIGGISEDLGINISMPSGLGDLTIGYIFKAFYTKISDTEYQFTNYHTILAQVLLDLLITSGGSQVDGLDKVLKLFSNIGLTIYFVKEGGYELTFDLDVDIETPNNSSGTYYFKIIDSSKIDTTIVKYTRNFYNPISFKEDVGFGEHIIRGEIHEDVTSLHSLLTMFCDTKEFYLFNDRYTNVIDISCMIGNMGNLSTFDIGNFNSSKVKTLVLGVLDVMNLMSSGSKTLYNINLSNNNLDSMRFMLAPFGMGFSSNLTFNQDMSKLKLFFSNIRLLGSAVGGNLTVNTNYDNSIIINGLNSAWTLSDEHEFKFAIDSTINDSYDNVKETYSYTLNGVEMVYNDETNLFECITSSTELSGSVIETDIINNITTEYLVFIKNGSYKIDHCQKDENEDIDLYVNIWNTSNSTTYRYFIDSKYYDYIDKIYINGKCSTNKAIYLNSYASANVEVKFKESFLNEMTDISGMFSGCSYITSIKFGDNFDTSNVTDMSYMFHNCSNITKIEFNEKFVTSNVTNMSSMFEGVNSGNISSENMGFYLTTPFNTSKVTNMNRMFISCGFNNFEIVSSFDTSNVTDMGYMFNSCTNVTSLDLNGFDTSNVTNMDRMFYNCNKLSSITFNNKFNTSKITDMRSMFSNCNSLTSLDLSSFDTSNVINMNNMFNGCSTLKNIEGLNLFNTSKVTNMSHMFEHCSNLTPLDLSSFDTSNVTDMGSMFKNCYWIKSIIFGDKWNTSKVTNMSDMFYSCVYLTSLDLSLWDTSKVTNMSYMFRDCQKLNSITMMSNVSNVSSYDYMFRYLPSNGTLTYPCQYEDSWNNLLVTNSGSTYFPSGWTKQCQNIEIITKLKIIENGFEITSGDVIINDVQSVYDLNDKCWKITHTSDSQIFNIILNNENIGSFNCKYHMNYIFIGNNNDDYFNITETISATSTSSLYSLIYNSYIQYIDAMFIDGEQVSISSEKTFSSVGEHTVKMIMNTSNVTSMSHMFEYCTNLTSLDLSNFDTSNVTDMGYMFYECRSLTELDLSNFDTSNVISMTSMFYNCNKLTSLYLSSFDTFKVIDMSYMFRQCSGLTELDLSNFDTSNVITMSYMFYNCSGLTSLDLSSFDTSNVTNMNSMFQSCSNLTSITFGDKADVSNVTSYYNIFRYLPSNGTLTYPCIYEESWNNLLVTNSDSTYFPSTWVKQCQSIEIVINVKIIENGTYNSTSIVSINGNEGVYNEETNSYVITHLVDKDNYSLIINNEDYGIVSYKQKEPIYILLGDNSNITTTLDFTNEGICNQILQNSEIVSSNNYGWGFDSTVNGLSYKNKMSIGNKPSNIDIKLDGEIVNVTYGLSCEIYDGIKVEYGDNKSLTLLDKDNIGELTQQFINLSENNVFKFSYFNDFITSLKDDKCWIKKIDIIKLP